MFTYALPTILWVWPAGLCFIPSVHSSLISCHVPLTSLSPSFKHGGRAAPSIQDDFLSLLQLPTVQVHAQLNTLTVSKSQRYSAAPTDKTKPRAHQEELSSGSQENVTLLGTTEFPETLQSFLLITYTRQES